MGIETAIIAGIGALASGVIGKRQQEKAMKKQEAAQRDAALHNVTVGRNAEDPAKSITDTQRVGEEQRQNAAKRRQSLASTVRGGSLLSSLGTGRSKLGGA